MIAAAANDTAVVHHCRFVADPVVSVRLLLLASAAAWENSSRTPGDS